MSKITFTNKEDNKVVALPTKNKVVAADMNEIKASVNYIYEEDFVLAEDKRVITGTNRAGLGKGTTDMGGDGGVSNFCAVEFEENFQAGVKYFRDSAQNILAIREYRGSVPDNTFDADAKYLVDSVIEFFDGTIYKCTDNTVGNAVWIQINSGGGNTMHYIPNADPDLYGGTEIWLFKNNNGDIQSTGFGKFYTPKYDQNVDGFGIWSNVGTYTIGDKTIWGGRAWTNLNGNVGTNLSIYELDSTEWEVIPYDDVNYNVDYAPITYDIANDFISGRKEVESGIEVSCSYKIAKLLQDDYSFPYLNPIKAIQWGNPYNYNTNKGQGAININNSYVESINAKGLYVYATANNGSNIDNLTANNGSNIGNITSTNNGFISTLTANNGSNIDNLTANNGSNINNLTSTNNGFISTLTANNSKINNLTSTNNGFISTLTANNSSINNLTATNNGNIRNLTAENGVISNLTIDNEKQLSKISVSGINYDFLGQTESNFDLIGLVATSKSVEFGFTLDFDGTAGKGEVGAITMPCWTVPEGFICTQTISKTITPLVSAGTSQVTLGYETDQADAIISLDSSAFVDVRLDTHAMGFIPTTQTRRIVGEVTGDAITSGTVEFQVKFSKV